VHLLAAFALRILEYTRRNLILPIPGAAGTSLLERARLQHR